jgi:hypothetical protein
VDVVVAARHVKRAVTAITVAYPELVPVPLPFVTRLTRGKDGPVVVDVMKPNQAVIKAALTETRTVRAGSDIYQIPSLEMALTMKFAAMISLLREERKKHLDAHDFLSMVHANTKINLRLLDQLGDLVYAGGGKEIVAMVARARAGERLVF